MRILIALFLSALCAYGSDKITASITVTNLTTNGMTFTVNSSVRTFTNNVVTSSSQVLTNNDVTGCGSKTNLFKQIGLNLFANIAIIDTGSNTFQLLNGCGVPLFSVTASAGWASVSYSTQTCSSATDMVSPFSTYPNVNTRTNTASQLVTDLNNYDTNSLNQNAPVASQLLGTNKDSTAIGKLTLSNTNNQIFGIISSMGISGNSVLLTNGVYFTPILASPIFTNAVNYGNAFSSPSTNGLGGEQFGASALTVGTGLAIGSSAFSTNIESTAVGPFSIAKGLVSTAVGAQAECRGDNSVAIGFSAWAFKANDTAIGNGAQIVSYSNSTALGYQASPTADNQVMLGSPGSSAVVPSSLSVGTSQTIGANLTVTGNAAILGAQTNGAHIGTNNFLANSDIAFARLSVSSLANGNNAAVPIGTNVFIEVSGPSAAFAINGISAGTATRDGKEIIILNQTGFQMTIANESGTDPTAANRIRTLGSATDLILTNSIVRLIYSGAASRWLVESHNP